MSSAALAAGTHSSPDASRPSNTEISATILWRDREAKGMIGRVLAGWTIHACLLLLLLW